MTGGAWKKVKDFLTAWIIELCTHLSDHHSPIRKGQVYNKHIGRSPKGLDLEEDVDHTAIAKKTDKEQKEIGNPYQVISQGVLGGKLGPMLVYNLQGSPVQSIKLAGSLTWHTKVDIKYKYKGTSELRPLDSGGYNRNPYRLHFQVVSRTWCP